MNLVPRGHRRWVTQRRQPVEGLAEEEEEGVFGRGDGERGSRGGAGCAAATCCPLRIFNLFVNNQSCFLWKINDDTCPVPEFIDLRFRENRPKTLLFSHRKRAFWACFRENRVYNFRH